VKSEFVRTPKYRVEDTTDATWKRKKYKRKRGLLPLLELGFAFTFSSQSLFGASSHVGHDPVSAAVLFRLGYMGVMSLLQTASGNDSRRLWRPLKT
jgi:hypothetical protein